MKKIFVIALSFILLFGLVGCVETVEDVNQTENSSTEVTIVIAMENTSQEESSSVAPNFTLTEIEKYDFVANPEQFALVNMNPCVLVDGVAYLYEDGDWNKIQSDKKISQIYSGDKFCCLTQDGKIIVGNEEWKEEYESYPLSSAGVFHNAEEMLKATEEKTITNISAEIFNEYIIATFADGITECFVNGKSLTVTDSLSVKEISGHFLLTDSGDVYLVSYPDSFETIKIKQVSTDKIQSISSCPSADRCVGIKNDGSIEVWSDVEGDLASDFQKIEMIKMGFNYCVAVREDGKACFSAYDKELETEITSCLDGMNKKAISVTCDYSRIAIMFEDYSICLIDF